METSKKEQYDEQREEFSLKESDFQPFAPTSSGNEQLSGTKTFYEAFGKIYAVERRKAENLSVARAFYKTIYDSLDALYGRENAELLKYAFYGGGGPKLHHTEPDYQSNEGENKGRLSVKIELESNCNPIGHVEFILSDPSTEEGEINYAFASDLFLRENWVGENRPEPFQPVVDRELFGADVEDLLALLPIEAIDKIDPTSKEGSIKYRMKR